MRRRKRKGLRCSTATPSPAGEATEVAQGLTQPHALQSIALYYETPNRCKKKQLTPKRKCGVLSGRVSLREAESTCTTERAIDGLPLLTAAKGKWQVKTHQSEAICTRRKLKLKDLSFLGRSKTRNVASAASRAKAGPAAESRRFGSRLEQRQASIASQSPFRMSVLEKGCTQDTFNILKGACRNSEDRVVPPPCSSGGRGVFPAGTGRSVPQGAL